MEDVERFKKLIKGGNSSISIVTYEERYTLDIIRYAALDLQRDMYVWSISGGVRNGLMVEAPFVADTETPVSGFNYFANTKDGAICVTLDVAEHLKAGQALRAIRDLIDRFEKKTCMLVMIDHEDKLPEVAKAYARPFEISFPGPEELSDIIRRTLRRVHREKPIESKITKSGLDIIIRNLRGLMRRQVQNIIIDTVAEDRRFDDDDIIFVLFRL